MRKLLIVLMLVAALALATTGCPGSTGGYGAPASSNPAAVDNPLASANSP